MTIDYHIGQCGSGTFPKILLDHDGLGSWVNGRGSHSHSVVQIQLCERTWISTYIFAKIKMRQRIILVLNTKIFGGKQNKYRNSYINIFFKGIRVADFSESNISRCLTKCFHSYKSLKTLKAWLQWLPRAAEGLWKHCSGQARRRPRRPIPDGTRQVHWPLGHWGELPWRAVAGNRGLNPASRIWTNFLVSLRIRILTSKMSVILPTWQGHFEDRMGWFMWKCLKHFKALIRYSC